MPAVVPPVVTVAEEGTAITQRPTLNFIGADVTAADNAASNRTDVTITSSGSVTFASGSGLPVYNVKSSPYSATGDGSTDDTTALQAAITAAQATAGGGIVFLPVGTYKITSPLLITAPVTILGESHGMSWQSNLTGVGAVIRNVQTAGNAITISRADSRPSVKLSNAVRIENIAIDTVAPAYAAYNSSNPGHIVNATAIYCGTNANYTKIRNCLIQRHNTGINLCGDAVNYTAFCTVDDCMIMNCKTYGIYDGGGVGNRIRSCFIQDTWDEEWTSTRGNGLGAGIYFTGGDAHVVQDCEIIFYETGIHLGNSNNRVVNFITDTCYNGVKVVGAHNILAGGLITACYTLDGTTFVAGADGIYVSGSYNMIQAVSVYRGTRGAVFTTGANDNVVSGCVMMSSDTNSAIELTGPLTGLTISGSVLRGIGSGYGINYAGNTLSGAITGNTIGNSASSTTPSGGVKVKSNYGLVDN